MKSVIFSALLLLPCAALARGYGQPTFSPNPALVAMQQHAPYGEAVEGQPVPYQGYPSFADRPAGMSFWAPPPRDWTTPDRSALRVMSEPYGGSAPKEGVVTDR